mgnify:CR=1 FL=1
MKTIEDASIEYVKSNFLLETIWEQETQDAFKKGVEFAQRWTSVEEELPPLGVPVICKYSMFGKEYHWAGTFYTEERIMHFIKKHLQITHWRLIELI